MWLFPKHEHQEDDCCHGHGEQDFVTMVDEETGEEFQFAIVDDFEFENNIYCVLLTNDEEPEALIVRLVEDEEGEHFMSLEEEEYERVFAFYDSILAEDEAQEEA